MPVNRGLVPPAILASTIALVACCIAWGALGVVSITPAQELTTELHRYLCIGLATATICSAMVNLTARIIRSVLDAIATAHADHVSDDGYATGYADGLAAAHARGNGARVAQMPSKGFTRS